MITYFNLTETHHCRTSRHKATVVKNKFRRQKAQSDPGSSPAFGSDPVSDGTMVRCRFALAALQWSHWISMTWPLLSVFQHQQKQDLFRILCTSLEIFAMHNLHDMHTILVLYKPKFNLDFFLNKKCPFSVSGDDLTGMSSSGVAQPGLSESLFLFVLPVLFCSILCFCFPVGLPITVIVLICSTSVSVYLNPASVFETFICKLFHSPCKFAFAVWPDFVFLQSFFSGFGCCFLTITAFLG